MHTARAPGSSRCSTLLFAANMLFTCLRRQYKTPFAVLIDGLTHNTSGNAAHQRLGYREESARRSAKRSWNAERLGIADNDVGSKHARGFQ